MLKAGRSSFYNADLSTEGLTSEVLLANLTTSTNFTGILTKFSVAAAKNITISIGGNDLLQIMKQYADDPDDLLLLPPDQQAQFLMQQVMEFLNNNHQPTPEQIQGMIDMIRNLETTYKDLWTNTIMFQMNWYMIISAVRLLNPNGNIYVNTIYNPFNQYYEPVLWAFAEQFIACFNASIEYWADEFNYKVADVHQAFFDLAPLNPTDPKMVAGLYDSFPLKPLHPTNDGYKVIYDLHVALMMTTP